MGADIYLNSLYEENNKKAQPAFDAAVKARNDYDGNDPVEQVRLQEAVEKAHDALYSSGYFRDSYNNSSLFWLLDLSWWQLPYDENGNLTIEQQMGLRDRVKAADIAALVRKKRDKEAFYPNSKEEEVIQYFTEKQTDLVNLLNESIKRKEPLVYSV